MEHTVFPKPLKIDEEAVFKSLQMEQMVQVLLIPIFGLFFALVLAAGEFLVSRHFGYNKKHRLFHSVPNHILTNN